MESANYIEILRTCLLPFGQRAYGNQYILHQDNSPIHSSQDCRQYVETEHINCVNFCYLLRIKICQYRVRINLKIYFQKIKAPAHSPDLNPIELLWADMKCFIRTKFCKSVADIDLAIEEYWHTLTPEKCSAFIQSLQEVVLKCCSLI
jgi:transposase